MIQIFRTMDGRINEISEPIEGCWISVVDPTATELVELSQKYQIDLDHLKAPLDEEERSRIEVEDNYTLIIVDVPITEERKEKNYFVTIP